VAAAAAASAADLTPPVFTPRSTPGATVADRDGPNAIATSPAADPPLTPRLMPEATITPRTMERARMATLTLEEDERVAIALQEEEDKELRDEQLALQLQHVEDEGRSEELAKETLSVAKERATKGKPLKSAKGGKKSPKAKAQRKENSLKPTARFHVDIGATKFTTELDKKLLTKPLLEVVCTPALVGYLADKPACVRIPLGAHPEDVTITVNGEVVDGKSAAKAYVDSDALETIVILILPGWAADVVQRKPEMIAEIVGPPIDATGLGELGELAGLGGLGDPSGIEQIDAWGIHTTTITAASVPFHINIGAGFIGGKKNAFETETRLNAAWLSKPLMDALISPALRAYVQSNPNAPSIDATKLKMLVDGEAVDGSVPAREYVRTDGSPALLELLLPMELEVRIH